jgi:hypothetical protein
LKKKEKRGLSRLRLPEKSVWMQKAHKRLYFVAQAQKEDLSEWSLEAWSYYLSLFYDAAVSGQAIYSRLCRWRETADLGRDRVFLQTLAEDMYGYFVPFMRRWWEIEKCFDPNDNLKTLPPEQIGYEGQKRLGLFSLLSLLKFSGALYSWDCIKEVLEGFVGDEEERTGWYRRLDWVEPEAHRLYLARMLESWLRVYGHYKEAVEGVWHSYVGRWGWLYWGRIVWGYIHLLGVTYRLCGGLGSLVWSQKVLGGYNWSVRGVDLWEEEWHRVVCPVGKDLSGYVGRLVVPPEDVAWCLTDWHDNERAGWLADILEARLGWLWSELAGLWGGCLIDEKKLGMIVRYWIEAARQIRAYSVQGLWYRKTVWEEGYLAGYLDEDDLRRVSKIAFLTRASLFTNLFVQTHSATTQAEALTLGAGLLWLSGRIEGLDWGCVGWYEEEAGEPLEAWGWKLGGWVSKESSEKLHSYHRDVLQKFQRYEACLDVLCSSGRMGKVLLSLLELYGLSLELLVDSSLVLTLTFIVGRRV